MAPRRNFKKCRFQSKSTNSRLSDKKRKRKRNKLKSAETGIENITKNIEESKQKEKKLKISMLEKRKSRLLQENVEEDRVIKKLEKQLKLNKRKPGTIPKSFKADGLDYLLEICDKNTSENAAIAEKHLMENYSDSDFDEDISCAIDIKHKEKKTLKTSFETQNKAKNKISNNSQSNNHNTSESEHDENDSELSEKYSSGEESEVENMEVSEGENIEDDDGEESNSEIENINDEESNDKNIDEEEDMESDVSENEIKEDIYGRKRDKDGNIITESKTYVPPQLRSQDESVQIQEINELKKRIKGILNKVSGSNMHWASTQIENIYNSNSRNSVNSAFSSVWTDAMIRKVTVFDRMAAEHAVLIAVLHANIGSEIGAYFLQILIDRYNILISCQQDLENKELDNLILSLSHIYNFKIFHASLMFEILEKLADNLTEKSIECILISLKTVGGTLRKEDPLSLKMFIQKTQEKAKTIKNYSTRERIAFLLDVLLAIKNNNMNKIPNYDPSYSEELKKGVKGIIRRGCSIVPLNIALNDLINADKQGKWWIVGSAWKGSQNHNNKQEKNVDKDEAQSSYLLQLADNQRINNAIRRNIFCIIMSAEDYIDAFDKLQHLGLSGQQKSEIIRVLINCCLQENTFNLYYALLAQKFCIFDRKFQISVQYSVWDKLKELESFKMFQITNLAKFLNHLFIKKAVPLSILKVVHFADLTKQTVRFMRQVLFGIILYKDSQSCLDVFQRISAVPKLHLFRESLSLFIDHFVLKNTSKKNSLSEQELSILNERCATINKILHSKSRFTF